MNNLKGRCNIEQLEDYHTRTHWWLGMAPTHPEFAPGKDTFDDQVRLARPSRPRAAHRGSLKRPDAPLAGVKSPQPAKLSTNERWGK